MTDKYEAKYGINVGIIPYSLFERNRQRLGISADTYLTNLMNLDYSGDVILEKPIGLKKKLDLNQTRLYRKEDLEPDKVK